jgi:peptidyl-prolyl cis-trans isomerase SurA
MLFDEAARQFSQGPYASKGGNLGLRPVSQLPELLVAAVEGLAPGDLSTVVESAGGFHIVRLNVRAQAGQQLVRQYRVRHILQVPNAVSDLSMVSARLVQVRDRILAGADFSTMVRLHSEHLPSRSNGGDLGWVGPGDVVPEFETILKELVPGQVSFPSRTRFGLHLIEVTDERLHDVGGKRLRAQARSTIRSRKIDERYEAWLNELIGRAFIEYRSPRFQAQ